MKSAQRKAGGNTKITLLCLDEPKPKERTVNDMICELFKKMYKQEMEIHKTMESKIDLRKETESGLLSLQNAPKPKKSYMKRKTELLSPEDMDNF